jgi:hypothetical protein
VKVEKTPANNGCVLGLGAIVVGKYFGTWAFLCFDGMRSGGAHPRTLADELSRMRVKSGAEGKEKAISGMQPTRKQEWTLIALFANSSGGRSAAVRVSTSTEYSTSTCVLRAACCGLSWLPV